MHSYSNIRKKSTINLNESEEKKGHYIVMKGKINKDNLTILNIYILNT